MRVYYEEKRSGFQLLVIRGGGLNATIAALSDHAFNPLEKFSYQYRVIALDLHNANDSSTGPLDVDRTWDAFTNRQLGLLQHLGVYPFMVLGFWIGGPMIWILLKGAGHRVVTTMLVNPNGYNSSSRTSTTAITLPVGHQNFVKGARK